MGSHCKTADEQKRNKPVRPYMRALLFSLLTISAPVWSETYYACAGEYGEVNFTDVMDDGCVTIMVQPTPLAPGAAQSAHQITVSLQTMADTLANARRAREEARADNVRSAPVPEPEPEVVEDRYLVGSHRPFPPENPIEPPPPLAPRKPFEPAFRPRR
jgi:hypothetical protein